MVESLVLVDGGDGGAVEHDDDGGGDDGDDDGAVVRQQRAVTVLLRDAHRRKREDRGLPQPPLVPACDDGDGGYDRLAYRQDIWDQTT